MRCRDRDRLRERDLSLDGLLLRCGRLCDDEEVLCRFVDDESIDPLSRLKKPIVVVVVDVVQGAKIPRYRWSELSGGERGVECMGMTDDVSLNRS